MPSIKRIFVLLFCFVLFSGHVAEPQSPAREKETKIVVYPFEVNAGEDVSYLKESLPKLIAERLREQGFEVQSFQQTMNILREKGVEYLDLDSVKDLTILSKAQYGVYGSFSKVGESISLDVRVVDAFGLKDPKAIFVAKEGLINLLPALDELVDGIRKEILREENIAEIEVVGNNILEKDVILLRLRIQEGDIFTSKDLNEELRRIYSLGYFDDVRILVEDVPKGKKIIIRVVEKPLIQAISVLGADAIDEDDILEAISTKTGNVLNPKVLSDDLDKIRQLYRKKGYYNAKVDYELEQVEKKKARLNIKIEEGEKLYIQEIRIQGAEKLDEDDLLDELALSERGFFSWLTGKGVLKEELLDRDAAAIEAYYGNRGFMDAQVGQPEVEFKEDGIYVTFKVVEGPRYKVGSVSFKGDLLESPEKLAEITRLDDLAEDSEYFDRSVLRKDSQKLADHYSDYGYAFAETDIELDKNQEEKTIDVVFKLNKDSKVYIRRVEIVGNTKTRDNVIRRELKLGDGDLFSGSKLARSNQRVQRLNYFETVDIQTVPTESPDELDLKIEVKEKPTGQISASGGYSSFEGVFVSGQILEQNLFGKGYSLTLKGTVSGRTNEYILGFWNPHLYDSKLGGGVELYSRNINYEDYEKDSTGGRLRTGYPLGEYTNLGVTYRGEKYRIFDVDDDASDRIKDFEGDNWASSITASIKRETTNRRFNPSSGTVNYISTEYAGGGIGGDDNFVKYKYDSSIYYPLFWKTVFHWHGRVGHVAKNSEEEIPPFERFYLGGMNSVRGYGGRDISPEDEDGEKIGGTTEFFTNFELLFPISEEIGLMAVTFFDLGNTWDDNEDFDFLYKSVGGGLRWYSPIGPLRFEYGYPLNELDGEKKGRFEFTVGQFF